MPDSTTVTNTILLNGDIIETGSATLQPGIGVTADIETDRRRVVSYTLSLFEHQIEEAGHEI